LRSSGRRSGLCPTSKGRHKTRAERRQTAHSPILMWGVTILRSAIIQATATAIRVDSLMLKIRARQVRGARTLCGGSDLEHTVLAALIVSVILERPTCLL